MARRLLHVALAGALFLAGCSQSGNSRVQTLPDSCNAPVCTAAIERLVGENLPALQTVETWESDFGPGLKLTTRHYEIFTTVLEPLMLRRIPGFIESAYRGYNSQLPRAVETKRKFTVYLFASRQQWEAFTKDFAGEQAPIFCKIKAGAYYLKGACVVYDIGRRRTFAALGHEGWHQFNSRYFKYRLPSWLDEGIAMLFEHCVDENGVFRFEPAQNAHRLDSLKDTLVTDKLMPLDELISISPGEVLASDQDQAVVAFYSQSYALVRYLLESDTIKHTKNYHRMLWDGLRGRWPLDPRSRKIAADRNVPRTVRWNRQVGPRLFRHYIGQDLRRVERDYVTFCLRIVNEPYLGK